MPKSPKQPLKSVIDACKAYLGEFGLAFTFFVLVLTISNFTYRVFGFKLVPFVKAAFDDFHAWFHFLMQILVFSWLTYAIEWSWYGLTWLCSLVLAIIPWRPHIVIPNIVSDIALLSVAFSRVFHSADLIVPRDIRAAAEKQTTPRMLEEIDKAEGPFWATIHHFVHRINAQIWNSIESIQKTVTRPFHRYAILQPIVKGILISIASTVLMWGFLRLSGYLINVPAARHLQSPLMVVRRRVLKYFGLSLLGAIVATAVFFVLNGWVAEWLEP